MYYICKSRCIYGWNSTIKIPGCKIQDISTSISITVKFEEMTDDDEDESDKHLEAQDRRYLCLI